MWYFNETIDVPSHKYCIALCCTALMSTVSVVKLSYSSLHENSNPNYLVIDDLVESQIDHMLACILLIEYF